MRVRSPLADLDIAIGEVRRDGSHLVLKAAPGSSVDAAMSVSAREAVGILGRIVASRAGLGFVLGLPYFWLRERFGSAAEPAAQASGGPPDVNKPW